MEMFRFILFFMICYYYTYKASGLILNQANLMLGLRIFFFVSMIFSLGVSIYIFAYIGNLINSSGSGFASLSVSMTIFLQVFTWLPLIVCAIFMGIMCKIKQSVRRQTVATLFDRNINILQMRTVQKLTKIICIVTVISLMQFGFQMVEVLIPSHSNTEEFGPNFIFLDLVSFFTMRFVAALSGVMLVVHLFFRTHRKKVDKTFDISRDISNDVINIDQLVLYGSRDIIYSLKMA